MDDLVIIIDWIEKHPVIGAAILCSIGYTLIGISKFFITKLSHESDYAKPVFWSFGKKYRILAVHKYEHSDDISGYRLKQHSRPDLWGELINVKSRFLNLRHKIVPINKGDILVVIISRNGREKNKCIEFNK